MSDEQMAERIARAQFGDLWPLVREDQQMELLEHWRGAIERIRAAGLEIVEAEDGR